jgi:AcrR family transcriptional regulator
MDTEIVTSKIKRPYRSAEETRKHVLDVATRLFYCEGIHAVGIDGLAVKAGVTTATLYRLFGSKEGLIIAYLRRADQEWFEWFDRTVAEGGIPHLFDELEQRVKDSSYHGCAFRMAMAEYPYPESGVHRVALENKLRTRARIRELAEEAGVRDADMIASQLMLIADGMCASEPDHSPLACSGAGPALARTLLNASISTS